MFAQGFVIKKELINGRSVKEEGKMGILNKQGARIVEVNDGKAKYTELSPQDIKNLISVRSNPSDLMERLIPLLKSNKPRHHAKRHHAKRHHTRRHARQHHTRRHARQHHRHQTKHHAKHHARQHHTRRHHPKQHHRLYDVARGHTKKHEKRQHTRKRKRKRTKHRKRR